jgi:hypothetical protein
MAANYVTSGSYQTVRVLSQTTVVAVEAIGIYTKPSDVYMVVQVPLAAYSAGNEDIFLDRAAVFVEGIIAAKAQSGGPLVTGVSYIQDIDSSGLLAAFLDFTTSYTPTTTYQTTFSAIVREPMTLFEESTDAAASGALSDVLKDIEAAHAKLVKTAKA